MKLILIKNLIRILGCVLSIITYNLYWISIGLIVSEVIDVIENYIDNKRG